jgi:hypothetical protein
MDEASTSATLLLERPERSADVDELEVGCGPASSPIESALLPSPAGERTSLGFLVRAPGLVLLATVFIVEGYCWLGVLHLHHASGASLLSGRVGLALLSVAAPLAAVVLSRGRRVAGWVLEDLVIGVAVGVTVATITALVVGGPVWRTVAGITDLVLAASVFGAVILGELARQRPSDPRSDRSSTAA